MKPIPYSRHLLHHTRFAIGQNIHRLRAERKMPLAKLAQLSHIPEHLLDHYELGKSDLRLEELLRIACALGVEVEGVV